VRNGLVNVNGEKTPAVLNGYDVVTFIRTSSIREQALRSRVLFYFKRKNSKKLKYCYKINNSISADRDIIYNKKKILFCSFTATNVNKVCVSKKNRKKIFLNFCLSFSNN